MTNLLKAQNQMKIHFDVKSKLKKFKEGDTVLLYLPLFLFSGTADNVLGLPTNQLLVR